ncbi:hypothetical protein CVD28_01445 [Bacillus sp. M6-12]|uniref:hypothetical protein n=1 Tax=Bacillus sp. M6-12 TaxID=2054166 RepID=UPI000C760AFB|nr:hypothetical protein [Bacillus sp. M6-12]PLS19099.1 hypothetical protein CVD28_01445 [Bacillus sp. M6-12]
MTIKFSKVELKAFPKLELITAGTKAIALKGSDYEGLEGVVTEVKYGTDKETENETILDIYVDFEEMPYASIESTHPHLNGTGISEVICGEDELGFKFEEEAPFYTTADGKAVCPHCYVAMERVTETQEDDISWNYVDGQYVKENGMGSSNGKRCDQCDGVLDDPNEEVFAY